MTGPLIIVPKYNKLGQGFSHREKAMAAEHPGRRTTPHGYQSPASWIHDLLSLRKVVCLCSYCRDKFDYRKHHYRKYYVADLSGITDGYQVRGKCDACKQRMEHCGGGTAYIHEATYHLVCIDPLDARRKARAAARAHSVWSHINQRR